jgi:hypothetical protein
MSARARGKSFTRRARAAERYQPKGSPATSAGGGEIVQRDIGAGAVEVDLAAKLGGEARRGKRGVQRAACLGGLAGGDPGIAALHPKIHAALVLAYFGLAGGILEHGGGCGPAPGRRISETEAMAGVEASALQPPFVGRGDAALGSGAGEGRAGAHLVVGALRPAGGGAAGSGKR